MYEPPFAVCQAFHAERRLLESNKEAWRPLLSHKKTSELCLVSPDHCKTKCKKCYLVSSHFNYIFELYVYGTATSVITATGNINYFQNTTITVRQTAYWLTL